MTVASSVASGYVTLLSLDEQLRVTESTLKAREEAFNLAKRQFETGYSSRLELMQSDSELRSTRAQVPVLHRLGWWLIGLVAIGLFGIPYIIAAWFLLHR